MPVWLLIDTTMSRLVNFAISILLFVPCDSAGGQNEAQKSNFLKAAIFLGVLFPAVDQSGTLQLLTFGRLRRRQSSRDGGAA